MAQWMVVQTKSGYESRAARHLRNAEFEIYRPVYVDQYRRKRSLFPRYVFVKYGVGWQRACRTVGVARVLMSGEDPGLVPARFIKGLQAQENRNGNIVLVKKTVEPVKAAFKIGQRLKVLRGTFQGFVVTFAGRGASGGDVGAFKLLGRTVRSEFPVGELLPI